MPGEMSVNDSMAGLNGRQVRRHILRLAVGLAVLLMVSAFFLMGMPGAALYWLGDLPFGDRLPAFHGDHWLPIAFAMNLLWPPAVPLTIALGMRLFGVGGGTGRRSWWRRMAAAAFSLALLMAWAVLLATSLHALAARQS